MGRVRTVALIAAAFFVALLVDVWLRLANDHCGICDGYCGGAVYDPGHLRYWPLSIHLKHQWSLLNLGLAPFENWVVFQFELTLALTVLRTPAGNAV
jgi:hypothetical protein